MEDKNCEMLFNYLKSILYDSQINTLDVEKLDEPFRKLGLGMQYLQKAVEEMKLYTENLSRGNLSGPVPGRDNFLCSNLKNLHANLNHLTWQAKQVAAGDYSQEVSYLGEFSDSFNQMIRQLDEREKLLITEKEKAQKRTESIVSYNELLMEMTRKRKEWVIVVDADNKEVVYCNRGYDQDDEEHKNCGSCNSLLSIREEVLNWNNSKQMIWESEDEKHRFFKVNSFPLEWRGRHSFVHIIENITREKNTEKRLTSKAYYDSGTGIRNRLFFMEYMETIIREQQDATLCYMDLDGLKFVNDHYGHAEGDIYILNYIREIQHSFRAHDVFARIGGDEFCVIVPGRLGETVTKKLAAIRKHFMESNKKEYPVSFSYGVYEIIGRENCLTLEEIVDMADRKMYSFKKKYKESLK